MAVPGQYFQRHALQRPKWCYGSWNFDGPLAKLSRSAESGFSASASDATNGINPRRARIEQLSAKLQRPSSPNSHGNGVFSVGDKNCDNLLLQTLLERLPPLVIIQ
jgi:hypothetical protein